MSLEPHSFLLKLIDRVALSEADRALLKANTAFGQSIAGEMADEFYNYLGRDAEMNGILHAREGSIHRLHETFVQWFCEMFEGIDDWGEAYAQRRMRIGLVHVRIGIGPEHVVPAMATVVRAVGAKLKEAGQSEELRDALGKICMIDLAFIEQAYLDVSYRAVQRETGWTENLFRRMIATGAAG